MPQPYRVYPICHQKMRKTSFEQVNRVLVDILINLLINLNVGLDLVLSLRS